MVRWTWPWFLVVEVTFTLSKLLLSQFHFLSMFSKSVRSGPTSHLTTRPTQKVRKFRSSRAQKVTQASLPHPKFDQRTVFLWPVFVRLKATWRRPLDLTFDIQSLANERRWEKFELEKISAAAVCSVEAGQASFKKFQRRVATLLFQKLTTRAASQVTDLKFS